MEGGKKVKGREKGKNGKRGMKERVWKRERKQIKWRIL